MKNQLQAFIPVILLILSFQIKGYSCTCFPYEPVFCKSVSEELNIVRAKVTNHLSMSSMEVEITDNINLEIAESTIIVWGQDGLNCGEVLGQFEIDDTLILAIGGPIMVDNQEMWYLEGTCGLHYLRVNNEIVTGQITETLESRPYEEFKDNLFYCPFILSSNELSDDDIKLFPNPTIDHLEIHSENDEIDSIEIYDLKGNLIKVVAIAEKIFRCSLEQLPHGMYFIKIQTRDGSLVKKIVKA